MQYCNDCGGEMKPLFISFFCPTCESGGNESSEVGDYYFGFVVNRNRIDGAAEYFFKTVHDAKKWRHAANLDGHPIWKVKTNQNPVWRTSTGSVPGVLLERRLIEVYKSEESWKAIGALQGCWVDEVVPGEPT